MEAFLVNYNRRTTARLTIEMLDIVIDPKQFSDLASNFADVELYIESMGLNDAEKGDVKNLIFQGNQKAMTRCFENWRGHNSSNATYKTLLEIVVKLKKEEIVENLLQYMIDKNINGIQQACIN